MYVPAFDPFHAIYRLLHILTRFQGDESVEVDRVCIFDFYLLFPERTYAIHLKADETDLRALRTKYVKRRTNPYNPYIQNRRLYARIHTYQRIALNHLAAYGLLCPQSLREHRIRLTQPEQMHELIRQIEPLPEEEQNVLSWLSLSFRLTPLRGTDGLKHRTRLLEYKYDGC